jgi:type II restriction enzyme
MDYLFFDPILGNNYTSQSQKIRILSEHWIKENIYCPSCGRDEIEGYENNRPVADFYCFSCEEQYELKSQSKAFGSRIADGAYRTMMERLRGNRNPNLLLMQYDRSCLSILNLLVIPKQFFIPSIIEERRPLSLTARRAGWVGCNISLLGVPAAGRIFLIKNGLVEPKGRVLNRWQATLFLRDQKGLAARGWLLSVMKCIDAIGKLTFKLEELYGFESELKQRYPDNNHVREKIRQQLQVLRDKGYLEFLGKGTYRTAIAGQL